MKYRRTGFTLIELMIVMSIIILLTPVMTTFYSQCLRATHTASAAGISEAQLQELLQRVGRDVRASHAPLVAADRLELPPAGVTWAMTEGALVRVDSNRQHRWEIAPWRLEFGQQAGLVVIRGLRPADRHNAARELLACFQPQLAGQGGQP